MKKLILASAAFMVLVGIAFAAPKDATFAGEISDSMCAQMGAHVGMHGAQRCTVGCVKQLGASYVLYDEATKTIYQLDDQKKPEAFAGQKVTVTGTLDKATKTIHVTGIRAAA